MQHFFFNLDDFLFGELAHLQLYIIEIWIDIFLTFWHFWLDADAKALGVVVVIVRIGNRIVVVVTAIDRW